jgi:ABC-type glycerol-3-phosphate transport system permease component
MNFGKNRVKKLIISYVVIGVMIFAAFFPILWTLMTSLKPHLDAFKMPPVWTFKPTLSSYKMLFFGTSALGVDFVRYCVNSLIITLLATFVSLAAGLPCAYGFSRFRFKGSKHFSLIILITRMLPPIGTAIPLFLIFTKFNLVDTHLGLILAYTTITIPFTVWMLRSFIDEIPVEIEESAIIDGCSRLTALIRILIPALAPGLASTAVYAFILAWNDFSFAIVLTNRNARTLPLISMAFMTEEGIMWGPMSAAIIVALLPPIFFFILTQKHITRGLTMGSVKG